MTTYRIKEFVCDAILITAESTPQDIMDFGVPYADASPDGSGFNLVLDPATGNSTHVAPDFYLVRALFPMLGVRHCFDVATAEEFAARYEEIVTP